MTATETPALMPAPTFRAAFVGFFASFAVMTAALVLIGAVA